MSKLLTVEQLKIGFGSGDQINEVVHGIDFDIDSGGETVAILGESGSGKSVSCLALTRLLPTDANCSVSGSIVFDGQDVLELEDSALRKIRGGGIAYIFQEPSASLNPVFTIGFQIAEAVRLHRPDISDVEGRVVELLELVGIREAKHRYRSYPHELSGGMAQRILIALALQNNPNVLVADEATSSLDAVNEKIILDLLVTISNSRGLSVLVITHDLRIAKNYCNDHYLIQNKTLINLSNNELADLESKAKHQIFDGLDIDNSKEILKVKDLSFGFNDNKNILKKVDFKIHQGEILGLVGLSGSGKSTLTKVLMKIYSPKKGTCTLFEKNLKEYTPKSYASNIQIVFQDLYGSLNPKRKILDILLDSFLIREELKSLSKDRISKNINYREEVDLYLEELGLNKDILLRFPKSLSGGQRQKILILKALLVKPKVIIFDEPMSSLDLKSQNEILSIIKSLYLEHKITILFITHDYRLVQSICNRVMVLSEGTIVEEGETSKVFTNPSNSATKKILEVVK